MYRLLQEEIRADQFKSVLTQLFPLKGVEAVTALTSLARESAEPSGGTINFVAALSPVGTVELNYILSIM